MLKIPMSGIYLKYCNDTGVKDTSTKTTNNGGNTLARIPFKCHKTHNGKHAARKRAPPP